MVIRYNWRDPVLINTVGHCAGALLFCVIMLLLIRNWRKHGISRAKLPLVAAALALGWNVGSLLILGSPDAGPEWIAAVATASFSMLTILPAVLLHVTLQGRGRLIVAAGYIISLCSAALHASELFLGDNSLHQYALLLVAFGFGTLAATTLIIGRTRWGKIDRSQTVSLVCLLLFTSSFVHFGYHHTNSPWSAEITWHHIGVPVALIVLLRDYRFLLLDTFLRFIVNFGLAVVYVTGSLAVTLRFHFWDVVRSSMFLAGLSLVAACLSLIVFAQLRNSLQGWMNRVVFRRQSIQGHLRAIEGLAATEPSEEELLAHAARDIAEFLRTDHFAIRTREAGAEDFHAEAQIPLRLSSGEVRYFLFGRRRGGQRYWGDDLQDLRQLGAAVVEQVARFRADELKRLVAQAELRALQAQINPHFLFNALNTLYGTIDRGSREARRMVLNLAEIFRYFLQGNRTLISLSEELRIVAAYLEIEALRLGDRFTSEVIVSDSAGASMIPILSIQPLVENAVKHGASLKTEPSKVIVRAQALPQGLRISVEDTGVGFAKSRTHSHYGMGLGLENVRRRLALSYGPAANFEIQSSDAGTTVSFLIPNPPDETSASTEPAAMHA